MDKLIPYEILDNLLVRFADSHFIRTYTDSVAVSAYINDRQIHIEGEYTLVLNCVQSLYEEFEK